MRHGSTSLLLALCAGFVACNEPVECTDEALTSVNLDVVDEDGDRVRLSTATYAVDGGEPTPCEMRVEGAFTCGVEEQGVFTLTASARGYVDAVEEVTVEADECHVIPVDLEMLLEVDECQVNFRPGVRVGVLDAAGKLPAGIQVFWTSDVIWAPCEGPDAKGLWSCAEEIAGELRVEVSAPGFVTAIQDVTVQTDGCHVTTERLDFVLVEKT